MKVIYLGIKEEIGPCHVNVKILAETANRATATYALRHIEKHSPDGFQWGYGGSGPSDLALSILTDYCRRFEEDESQAEKYYQKFKKDFIATAGNELYIGSEQINDWLIIERLISFSERKKEI